MDRFRSDSGHAGHGAKQSPEMRLAKKRRMSDDPLKHSISSYAKKSLLDNKSAKVFAVFDESQQMWAEVDSSDIIKFCPYIRFVNLSEQPEQTAAEKATLKNVTLGEMAKKEDIPKAVAKPIQFIGNDQMRFFKVIRGPPNEVIIDKYNMQIFRRDIIALADCNLLNERLVIFYLRLIYARSIDNKRELPRVYPFSTYFIKNLLQGGCNSVSASTRNVDIFSKDILIMPFECETFVWSIIIVNMRLKRIQLYNYIGEPSTCFDRLKSFLKLEGLYKQHYSLDLGVFKFEVVDNRPLQSDPRSFSLISLMFAESVARGAPFEFNKDDMFYYRCSAVLEVARGKLAISSKQAEN